MKIGKPTELPDALRKKDISPWRQLWNQIKAMPEGKWLPITCENKKEVSKMRLRISRYGPIKTHLHDGILYVAKTANTRAEHKAMRKKQIEEKWGVQA